MAMSEEARQKLSDRMVERHRQKKREAAAITANAKALNEAVAQRDDDGAPLADPVAQAEPTITQTEYRDLLRHMSELEARLSVQPSPPASAQPISGPQIDHRGRLTGVHERFIVDPAHYPDPTPRLAKESKLQRFAFDINYELDYEVATTQYQTQDGINTREPKFTLKLVKVVMDDETGEPTNGRFVLREAVFHEDPQAALTVARDQGLNPDDFGGEPSFLDEMRYLRYRDWLIEAFYPPRTAAPKKNKKEMVIGNKIVQYYEVSSVDSAKINFGELDGKVKG